MLEYSAAEPRDASLKALKKVGAALGNDSELNLIILCGRCHGQTHRTPPRSNHSRQNTG